MHTVTYTWLFFILFCLAASGLATAFQRATQSTSHRWSFWIVFMAMLATADVVALIRVTG